MEIGALLSGVTLAMSPYRHEINSKMISLRDFFIVIFFVLLGSHMEFGSVMEHWIPIVIFSLFVLIGNPLIVLILMGRFGYTKRTGFLAGLTVAQISEFSLILIAMGISMGHIGKEALSIITAVGLITITGSTYLILYSDKIYASLSKHLTIFEKKERRLIKRKILSVMTMK